MHKLDGIKRYYEMANVGTVKYLVNTHDGVDTHKDGSPFYGVATFSNKRKKDAFIRALVRDGYVHRDFAPSN